MQLRAPPEVQLLPLGGRQPLDIIEMHAVQPQGLQPRGELQRAFAVDLEVGQL